MKKLAGELREYVKAAQLNFDAVDAYSKGNIPAPIMSPREGSFFSDLVKSLRPPIGGEAARLEMYLKGLYGQGPYPRNLPPGTQFLNAVSDPLDRE